MSPSFCFPQISPELSVYFVLVLDGAKRAPPARTLAF
jgi:hypothetical protein